MPRRTRDPMHEAPTGARAIAAKQAILATAGRGPEPPERAICTSDRRRHGGRLAQTGDARLGGRTGGERQRSPPCRPRAGLTDDWAVTQCGCDLRVAWRSFRPHWPESRQASRWRPPVSIGHRLRGSLTSSHQAVAACKITKRRREPCWRPCWCLPSLRYASAGTGRGVSAEWYAPNDLALQD